MTSTLAPAAGRALPVGTLSALAIGFVLYLTTSLVLGPSTSRVLNISLSLPSVESAPQTQASHSGRIVAGSRLIPALTPVAPMVARRTIQSTTSVATSTAVAPAASAAHSTEAPPVKAARGLSKRSHYHDADERIHRLARRR